MIRVTADVPISVTRWCDLLGVPRATWYRWKAAVEAGGSSAKGPWPTPAQDAIEPDVVRVCDGFDGWGHRKVWGRLRLDDIVASPSTVKRTMGRNGLLQPAGYTGDLRRLAQARKAAFVEPPSRRNRVWQIDFSELESLGQGVWNLGGVADYVGKVALAMSVTMTKTARDAVAMVDDARRQAEAWLDRPLLEDLVDPATGELVPIVIVSDNGSAFRSSTFAAYIESRPEFVHVRTRYRAPHTNGVIERTFGSFKYEHLYRRELADGLEIAREVAGYQHVFNHVRPHEHLDFQTPYSIWIQPPTTEQEPTPDPQPETDESVSLS